MTLTASLVPLLFLTLATPAAAESAEPPNAAPAPAEAVPAEPTPVGAEVPSAPPVRSIFAGSDGGWEAVARAGTWVPTLGKFKALHAATALDVGLRRRLGAVLALEAGAGYVANSTHQAITDVGEYGPETWDLAELRLVPLTAGVRATYRAGPVEVFATAAGGVYWCHLYKSAANESVSYGAAAAAFQPGASVATGTGFRLTPSITASYEVRYTWLRPVLFGAERRLDGVGLTAALAYGF